ncbi:helix-turn-helix domain-containing protein [Bradyrhizobium sp. 521_C7_N1_3]|uniref:helix-turn-helix domain-containing protein n=1 Tax=Bradyrhizobium sp. 521_C7_N1_3 TaxID=3240368 RepID=UPI003F8CE70B
MQSIEILSMESKVFSVRQMKAARALLAWSQGDLAKASGVSEPTIARLESEDGEVGGRAETGDRLRAALEKAGVEFIPENGGGAGVRMKKRKR